MSAAHAAAALLECDVNLYEAVLTLPPVGDAGRRARVLDVVEEFLRGTWTLTLAARAANVEEVQVVAAILLDLGVGSRRACLEEARRLLA